MGTMTTMCLPLIKGKGQCALGWGKIRHLGIRLPEGDPDAGNPSRWQGTNLLGFALMEVRDELRRVTQKERLCDWGCVES